MRYVTNHGTNPAQREIVHRRIDWNRIRSHYKRYPMIGRTFPLTTLKRGCEKAPYYCHYMAWRLGTWTDESPFQRLEELLEHAESLTGWEHESSLISDPDFSTFWSLVWQLQVAEHLSNIGSDVRWAKSGPDLSVVVSGKLWYVECYTYQKSFGLLNFIEEVLAGIDSTIRIRYDLCLPFSLPTGEARREFLHKVLSRFLNPEYLARHKRAAEQEYPVLLYKDQDSSLHIYVEGSNVDAYIPGKIPKIVGSLGSYREVAVQEAIKNKRNSNDLANHRPNLVAVNYLLSMDYQLAESSLTISSRPDPDSNIDVLVVSSVGIDEKIVMEQLKIEMLSESIDLTSLAGLS